MLDKKLKSKFILDENKNAIPATLMEWANFFENELEARIVRQDEVNGYWISTVFIGHDHNYPELHNLYAPGTPYKPAIFETLVFKSKGGGEVVYSQHYSTWQEAEAGHKKATQWVIEGAKDER